MSAIELVSKDGYQLEELGELRKDKEVVMAAVLQNGDALQYASPALQKDRDVVMAAVSQNGDALCYASSALKRDRDIVLAAVSQQGDALLWSNKDLKNDRSVVMAAVLQNGNALQYASSELQGDRDIVLAAVKNGGQIFWASKDLKNDPEILAYLTGRTPEQDAIVKKYKDGYESMGIFLKESMPSNRSKSEKQSKTQMHPLQRLNAHGPFGQSFKKRIQDFAGIKMKYKLGGKLTRKRYKKGFPI